MEETKGLELVSIYVVTYNSSAYVLETLNSIYAQTYPAIELIISDDCSSDSTVEICRNWIEENRERFQNTVLLESDTNTGISANVNRAEKACTGEWVKGIAGDDLLLPNAIESFISFATQEKNSNFIFSKVKVFGTSQDIIDFYENVVFTQDIFQLSPKQQYEELVLRQNHFPAPTFFFRRAAMLELGVECDERIPMMDDWPRWINMLKREAKFYFLPVATVKYRIHSASATTGVRKKSQCESDASLFVLYQFRPQWKYDGRPYLLGKYLYARGACPNSSIFWRMLLAFFRKSRKIMGKTEEPMYAAPFIFD